MLHSYVLTDETGFAPAVDREGKFLTLCTCMVKIRKRACEGNWILGTVGKSLSKADFRKIVYLAKVTEVLEPRGFAKYWRDQRFLRQNDRVYKPVKSRYESVPWNPHSTKKKQLHDWSSSHGGIDRVLISKHFYYFGGRPRSVVSKWRRKFVVPRSASTKFKECDTRKFTTFAQREWRDSKNRWVPPTQPKGLLIHVGDDAEPGNINDDRTHYRVELLDEHHDPDLQHLTFGDWSSKTGEFDNMDPGDYLFFNFKLYNQMMGPQWYVTAYYRIAKVRTARDLIEGDLAKKAPYRYNSHIIRGDLLPGSEWYEDRGRFRMFVGKSRYSNVHISKAIAIDQRFWKTLWLGDKERCDFVTRFKQRKHKNLRYTVEQFNGSYLRTPKPLAPCQTAKLLKLAKS